VNGRPNVRACRHVVEEGDRVETENAWPSPRWDLLGAIDVVFPRSLDTLRGFRRPAWATRAYQRVVRRLAGYGAVPDQIPDGAPSAIARRWDTDVVIVGAGTSGRAAAEALVRRGIRPLVVDRALEVADVPGADLASRTTVTFLPPPRPTAPRPFVLLGFEEPDRGVSIRAKTVVLAVGGYDGPLLFEGSDRPGVMAADLLTRMAPRRGSLPIRRAVVVGGGRRAGEVLDRIGPVVIGVVAPGEISPDVVRRASELSIPLYPRSLVVRAVGRSRVRSLDLRTRGQDTRFSLACDAVVLAHRRLPNAQLLFQADARMVWRPDPGGYFPVVDATGGTTVPGLYVAGTVAGFAADERRTSGERAAASAAGVRAEATPTAPAPAAADVPADLREYYRELLTETRTGKWVVCPCEDVLLEDIEDASRAGFRGIEVVKRYTGVGTGLCQGRYCLPDALLLLAQLEGRPAPEVGYIRQRPPVVPTPLSALAAAHEEFAGEEVA
jgi:sarcosine oxidase, subunit alpha